LGDESATSVATSNTEAAVGNKSIVEAINECHVARSFYGWMTATGKETWILTYSDADEVVVENRLTTKIPAPTWPSRDNFNSNLVLGTAPTPAFWQDVDASRRLLFDGMGLAVSQTTRVRDFYFDFASSSGVVSIKSRRSHDIIQ
jgi:hypothetical protein